MFPAGLGQGSAGGYNIHHGYGWVARLCADTAVGGDVGGEDQGEEDVYADTRRE